MKLHTLTMDNGENARYSNTEIDIYCRTNGCGGTLADIIHICPKRLVTKCRNCSELCEIETEVRVMMRVSN